VDGYLEAVGDIAAQAARVVRLLTDDELHARNPVQNSTPPIESATPRRST
jgi:hypothetical protein